MDIPQSPRSAQRCAGVVAAAGLVLVFIVGFLSFATAMPNSEAATPSLGAAQVSAQTEPLPPESSPPPQEPAPEQPPPPPPEQPPPPPPPSYPPVPAGSGEGRRVVYSNAQQRVWLIEADGAVVDSWLVSGRRGMPRNGYYKVFSKSRYSSARGGRVRMEYMVRFARGRSLSIGFHSIPVTRRGVPIQSEAELGRFRSAGCVRQRLVDAATMWDFAPVGTPVVVVESRR